MKILIISNKTALGLHNWVYIATQNREEIQNFKAAVAVQQFFKWVCL